TVRDQDQTQLLVMAYGERSLAQREERAIIEVEEVDFLRRIESDVSPAGIRAGRRGTLMHTHFTGGHIHGINPTGWVVGERHSHGSSTATAPTTTITIVAADCKKSEDQRGHRSKPEAFGEGIQGTQCVHLVVHPSLKRVSRRF